MYARNLWVLASLVVLTACSAEKTGSTAEDIGQSPQPDVVSDVSEPGDIADALERTLALRV